MRTVADAARRRSPRSTTWSICAGGYDMLAELVCTDDEHLLEPAQRPDPHDSRRVQHRDVRLSQARQTDLRLGDPMSLDRRPARRPPPATTCGCTSPGCPRTPNSPVPIIARGEGAYIYDTNGKRYLDGLAGLFVVQAGHGRQELADAAAKQAGELAFFPIWSYAHPKAIELADRLADLAPGDLNRVFFTTGGSEAVESAWKLARSYFKRVGKPGKVKAISRHIAYHGTSMGALSITGLPGHQGRLRAAGAVDACGYRTRTSTARPRAPPARTAPTPRRSAAGPPTGSPRRSSSRARTRSPASSSSRCRTPAAASRRRPATSSGSARSATEYDVLLVSDEVICAFGRLGEYFGAQRYGYQPDIITCAKGMTSGYIPAGAMIVERPAGRAVPARTPTGSPTASRSAGTRSRPRSRWPTWTSSSART